MSDTFLPKDLVSSKHEIVQELYVRLSDVRRAIAGSKTFTHDEFDLGINYRLHCEAEWLEDLLDKIERS